MNSIENSNSRNKELAISATSKIFEKVSDALRKTDTDKRWFWELLQNAKDTVVYKTGVSSPFNQAEKKVDVKLILKKNERGENVLVFEHNGNPFLHSNHPYKYDDPKCLLLADSGKIEEEESQREDVTGQFGTGFLSTHILSLRILVEGIFIDRSENMNEFNFELDRSNLHKKLELVKKVEKSLDQYDGNFSPISKTDNFITSFTYFLDDNQSGLQNGLEIVKNGLSVIEKYIPYVLSFSKEIHSVEIKDELVSNSRLYFTRKDNLTRKDKQIILINIIKETNAITNGNKDTCESQNISIALISDVENHIDLATQLYGNGNEIHEINNDQAVLFCTFPLIGSENWRFPLMFNCKNFYPETERNGITLIKNKDNGNRDRVTSAIELYKKFCSDSIESGYKNLLFLADTRNTNCPNWCDEEWYKNSLNNIREFLLEQPIVLTENGNHILLKDTLFPQFRGAEKLSEFWDICYQYSPLEIPCKSDAEKWNSLLTVEYTKWDKLKMSIDRLLKELEELEDLSTLASDKFDGDELVALDWLKKLYHFIIEIAEKNELFDDYAIVPNQNGTFMTLDKLRYDANIPEELKDVLVLFDQDKRDILIHRHYTCFNEHYSLDVEDISNLINKHITDRSKVESDDFKKGMFLLSSYFTSDNSKIRNAIFDFSLVMFPDEAPISKHVLADTADFNWENVNNWILRQIVEKIEEYEKVENILELTDYVSKMEWLNQFIGFLNDNSYEKFLSNHSIIPNQYNEFCSIDDLYNDENKLPDNLKDILYLLTNKDEDWNSILINSGIELELHRAKTLKEIGGLIDDYVKENRDNLENQNIRKALLELVRWVSDNKQYPVKICLNGSI